MEASTPDSIPRASPARYPRIWVRGGPAERGRRLGREASARVRRSIEIYREIFAHYAGWTWAQAREHALRYAATIASYEPRYLEELEGIAEGAGVELADVLALNVRTEIMFAQTARRECTAFAALPAATAAGRTLLGQNWDWNPDTAETVVVLEAEQDRGPNYVTVVEAGLLAKAGMNASGLGLVTNALVTDADLGEIGVPYHVLLRRALDAESLSEAVEAITGADRASSGNYLLARPGEGAANIEAAPGGRERAYVSAPAANGVLAHTNHFLNRELDAVDAGLRDGPDSPLREAGMRRWLERESGGIDPQGLVRILTDHTHAPDGICSHPDPELPPPERYATVASVVMDLEARALWLADGNPCRAPYRRLDYGDLLREAPTA